jgi:hypothetical protein
MKDFGKYILEKLRVSKHISAEINLDTFKNGIDIFSITHLTIKSISYRGSVYVTYYTVKDRSGNIIAYLENFDEGELIYTLIVPDETYDYFCNEFDLEEADEYGMICPEELYDILFYKIPDYPGEENIYLTSVSMWLNDRENLLSKNESGYKTFIETYAKIKNTLSR